MSKTYKTKSGKVLTDADIEAMAAEEETAEYDVEELMTRRGRPRSQNSMSETVQLRLDKDLRAALQTAEGTWRNCPATGRRIRGRSAYLIDDREDRLIELRSSRRAIELSVANARTRSQFFEVRGSGTNERVDSRPAKCRAELFELANSSADCLLLFLRGVPNQRSNPFVNSTSHVTTSIGSYQYWLWEILVNDGKARFTRSQRGYSLYEFVVARAYFWKPLRDGNR